MATKFVLNRNKMSKILRVIEPFFVLGLDDTFVLSPDGTCYVAEHSEEFHTSKEDDELTSSYNSSFTISLKWAKQLIEDGYLEEVEDKQTKSSFVNVFDEIDKLLAKYTNELNDVKMMMAGEPECLIVEKTTVLKNIIKVLEHLKSLRK